MFSRSCEYAIRAIIFLSAKGIDNPISITDIANALDSPSAYTAKILQKLAKQKIINSNKGNSGGYYLDKNAMNKVRLSDIVDAIDGDGIYTACGLGLKQCSSVNPCPLHDQFKKIRADLKLMLESTRISSLADGLKRAASKSNKICRLINLLMVRQPR